MRQQALWYDTSRVKQRRRGEVFMGSTGAPQFWPEESSRGKISTFAGQSGDDLKAELAGGHGACACAPMKIAPSTKLWGVTDLAEQLTLALAQHHRTQLLQPASKRFNCEFITQT